MFLCLSTCFAAMLVLRIIRVYNHEIDVLHMLTFASLDMSIYIYISLPLSLSLSLSAYLPLYNFRMCVCIYIYIYIYRFYYIHIILYIYICILIYGAGLKGLGSAVLALLRGVETRKPQTSNRQFKTL